MILKQTMLLTGLALAGAFCVANARPAAAAEMPAAFVQPATPSAAVPVYYSYHHHHYAYRWKGRYYNHRRHGNGGWSYY